MKKTLSTLVAVAVLSLGSAYAEETKAPAKAEAAPAAAAAAPSTAAPSTAAAPAVPSTK